MDSRRFICWFPFAGNSRLLVVNGQQLPAKCHGPKQSPVPSLRSPVLPLEPRVNSNLVLVSRVYSSQLGEIHTLLPSLLFYEH